MIDPASDARHIVLIRLFRLWAMAREDGQVTLRKMHEAAVELRLPLQTSSACSSLFELVEAELGRPLVRECCCAREFSPDELALLSLVRIAPETGIVRTTQGAPHGLPGAIRWAAAMVRQSLGWPDGEGAAPAVSNCPFERSGIMPAD